MTTERTTHDIVRDAEALAMQMYRILDHAAREAREVQLKMALLLSEANQEREATPVEHGD